MTDAAEQWDPLVIHPLSLKHSLSAADGSTRDQHRSRRKRAVRSSVISCRRMPKRELELGRLLYPETGYWRPRTRRDCSAVPRPCPYVACRWNLYLDVHPLTHSIRLNFPDLEPWEMTDSCALDVAEYGGVTIERCGELMNLTRERARQLEVIALERILQLSLEVERLREYADGGAVRRRVLPRLSGFDRILGLKEAG